MARNSPILTVKILSDASQAASGFNSASGQVESFASKVESAAKKAALIGGAMLVAAKDVIDSASDLQQAVGGVEAVFKDNADQVLTWGENAAQTVGLAASEYDTFATLLGSQLKNAGVPMDQLAGKTNDLITTGADLSAMFGGTTSDAVDALSAALKGEYDPMEKYGVSLSANAIAAQMAADGTSDLTGSALSAAKANAALEIITQQTADATGAFARESDTAAGQQQRASAEFENAKAALGESLLPAYTTLMETLGKVATYISEHTRMVGLIAAAVGTAAGSIIALNTAFKTYENIKKATTVIKNIGSGVVGGVQALGRVRDGFNNANVAASSFSGKAGTLGGKLRSMVTATTNGASALGKWARQGAASTAAAIKNTTAMVAQKTAQVASAAATKVAAAAQRIFNTVMNANPVILVVTAILALIAVFVVLYQKNEAFRNVVNTVWNGIKTVITSVWNGIKTAAEAVFNFLQPFISVFVEAVKAQFRLILLIATAVWDGIKVVIETVWGWISPFIMAAIDGIVTGWNLLKAGAEVVWNGVMAVVQFVIDAITIYIQTWVTIVTTIWEGLKTAASAVWDWISTKVSSVVDWITQKWNVFKAAFTVLFDGLKSKASEVWTNIRNAATPIIDAISNGWTNFKNNVSNIFNAVKDAASTAWNNIKSAADTALSPIRSLIDRIKGAFDNVVGAIQNVINWLKKISIPSALSSLSSTLSGLFRSQPIYASVSGTAVRAGGAQWSPMNHRASSVSNESFTVNVSGGIESSDAIARRVEGLLEARRRRNNGPTVMRRAAKNGKTNA